jgi:hypothetical protein
MNLRLHVKMQCLASNSEMQVTECFSNLLFSIRTHFAVDSALLEEFSFPQAPFIVATHNICKRVSHLSWTAVTVISRLQFAIQSLGHCGCTLRARNRARRSARMHSAPTHAPPRAAPLSARARTHAHARAPLSARARTRAAQRARAQRCRSADVPVRALRPVHAAKGPRPHVPRMGESVIQTYTSHPFPPRQSHLLPPAGLAVGRRCSSRRAPRSTHPATAACGQWSGRHTSAHGCRPGPRRLPARPVRGSCRPGPSAAAAGTAVRCGCRHGRSAAAAGTTGPPRLLALPARGGCRHGRPALAAGTAGPRRLLARHARGGYTKMDPKIPEQ